MSDRGCVAYHISDAGWPRHRATRPDELITRRQAEVATVSRRSRMNSKSWYCMMSLHSQAYRARGTSFYHLVQVQDFLTSEETNSPVPLDVWHSSSPVPCQLTVKQKEG